MVTRSSSKKFYAFVAPRYEDMIVSRGMEFRASVQVRSRRSGVQFFKDRIDLRLAEADFLHVRGSWLMGPGAHRLQPEPFCPRRSGSAATYVSVPAMHAWQANIVLAWLWALYVYSL